MEDRVERPTDMPVFGQPWTRRDLLKRLGIMSVAVSVPGLIAACGDGGTGEDVVADPTSEGPAGPEVGTLTWMVNRMRAIDTTQSLDVGTQTAMNVAFDTVLGYSTDLQLVPRFAESWEQVDPTTYRYTIRQGVTFWDGSPVTMDDVVFSMDRHRSEDVGSSLISYFKAVESVEATGDNELTVTLSTPDAFWQYMPTFVPIVKKAFVEEKGEEYAAPGAGTVMGTGPYVLDEYKADEGVTYTRNEDYWGEKPPFQAVDLRLVSDIQTGQMAARGDAIDGTFDVQITDVEDWERIERFTVSSTPSASNSYFFWNMDEEPWSDVHVRRAFSHALDREGLVQAIAGGHATPATSMVPRPQWAGFPVPEERIEEIYASLTTYEFDLDKAADELSQSSSPDGFSAAVKVADNQPALIRIAQNLAENLSEVGVDLSVEEVPGAEMIGDVFERRDLQFRIVTFAPDYHHPGNFPSYMFPSRFAEAGAFNLSNWKNSEVDGLVAELEETVDAQKQADTLEAIMQIEAQEIPYLTVWWSDLVMALQDEFVYPDLTQLFPTQWIQKLKSAA